MSNMMNIREVVLVSLLGTLMCLGPVLGANTVLQDSTPVTAQPGGDSTDQCFSYYTYSPRDTDSILEVQVIWDFAETDVSLYGDTNVQQPTYQSSSFVGAGFGQSKEILITNHPLNTTYYFTVQGSCNITKFQIVASSRGDGPIPGGQGVVEILSDPYHGVVLGFTMASSNLANLPCQDVQYELWVRYLGGKDGAPSVTEAGMATVIELQKNAIQYTGFDTIDTSSCGYIEVVVGNVDYNLYTLVVRDQNAIPVGLYALAAGLDVDPGQRNFSEVAILIYVWVPVMMCCCIALICSVLRSRREDEWIDEDDLEAANEATPLPLGPSGAPEHGDAVELLPIRRNRKKRSKAKKNKQAGGSAGSGAGAGLLANETAYGSTAGGGDANTNNAE